MGVRNYGYANNCQSEKYVSEGAMDSLGYAERKRTTKLPNLCNSVVYYHMNCHTVQNCFQHIIETKSTAQ